MPRPVVEGYDGCKSVCVHDGNNVPEPVTPEPGLVGYDEFIGLPNFKLLKAHGLIPSERHELKEGVLRTKNVFVALVLFCAGNHCLTRCINSVGVRDIPRVASHVVCVDLKSSSTGSNNPLQLRPNLLRNGFTKSPRENPPQFVSTLFVGCKLFVQGLTDTLREHRGRRNLSCLNVRAQGLPVLLYARKHLMHSPSERSNYLPYVIILEGEHQTCIESVRGLMREQQFMR